MHRVLRTLRAVVMLNAVDLDAPVGTGIRFPCPVDAHPKVRYLVVILKVPGIEFFSGVNIKQIGDFHCFLSCVRMMCVIKGSNYSRKNLIFCIRRQSIIQNLEMPMSDRTDPAWYEYLSTAENPTGGE